MPAADRVACTDSVERRLNPPDYDTTPRAVLLGQSQDIRDNDLNQHRNLNAIRALIIP